MSRPRTHSGAAASPHHRPLLAAGLALAVAGCDGPQSALGPAGVEAERVAALFWFMVAAAALIWLGVIGAAFYATRVNPGAHAPRIGHWLILGGGVVFPTLALAVLLGYALVLMRDLRAGDAELTVTVVGEQWWWRVAYQTADGAEAVVSANEVRLPVGQPTELRVLAGDVIHSFWIPSLGGKLDMIPGQDNRFVLRPTETGTFRGQCAEFCGDSHALMAFAAVVMEPDAFAAWLAEQAEPAAAEGDGLAAFLKHGCGACHAIRGTPADGAVGPDLTHVGGRETLAAGVLPMTVEAMTDWIANTEAIKPGSLMPSFGMLPEEDIAEIAAYLVSLE